MRLQRLYIDVGFYGEEKKLDPFYNNTVLRRRTDVLGLVLDQCLKAYPMTNASHGNIMVLAATERRGNYRIARDNVLKLGIADPANNAIDKGMDADTAYDHFMWMVETAFRREDETLAGYLPVLREQYEVFKADGFQSKWIRLRRTPRGQKYEYLLELTLDEHALSVDFVCNDKDEVIYREQVMQTGPYPEMLSRSLNTFEFSDNRISIRNNIPTKIPPNELSSTKHGDVKDYPKAQLIHYKWARDLKEILPSE